MLSPLNKKETFLQPTRNMRPAQSQESIKSTKREVLKGIEAPSDNGK